jgi:extradiol dioxygenase family protein
MHFGYVVTGRDWFAIRDRIRDSGFALLKCMEPTDSPSGRGKLLVADPSGNIVEINSVLLSVEHC